MHTLTMWSDGETHLDAACILGSHACCSIQLGCVSAAPLPTRHTCPDASPAVPPPRANRAMIVTAMVPGCRAE